MSPVNLAVWQVNRWKVDPDSLLTYQGKHIAWNGDCTSIVADGDSYEDLYAKLDRLGVRIDQVVHEYVDTCDGIL